ncbi:MAG: hypothetical protein ACRED7_09410 [Stellaceae bacterium]
MRIDLNQLWGSTVLAGAVHGRKLLTRLLETSANEPEGPTPLFLDFSRIEFAAASFLRESILAFRNVIRGRRSRFYPVIANANEAVRDELLELVHARGDVLMTCKLDEAGHVSEAVLLGDLDPKQRMTFDLVRKRGETDASELMQSHGKSEGITNQTAWNNRLSALTALGLVVEISLGRSKRYKPLFQRT